MMAGAFVNGLDWSVTDRLHENGRMKNPATPSLIHVIMGFAIE